MGLSWITALEMFTNPGDLEIAIGRANEGEKFSLNICRGPGHHYKPMITSTPYFDTVEEAIKEVKRILGDTHKALMKDFEERGSFPAQYLKPDGQGIDPEKVLNPELIERILAELREHQVASTHKMLAAKSAKG
jgi:hypothetical protein